MLSSCAWKEMQRWSFDCARLSDWRRRKSGNMFQSGDRACLILARNMNAIAFTADRAWQSLDIGVQVRLIR
jgi:PIN domain nuclease of toxin-antitoxin system